MNAKKAKALRLIARRLQETTGSSSEWNDVQIRDIGRSPKKVYADMEAQGLSLYDLRGTERFKGNTEILTSQIRMHNPDSGRAVYKAMKKQEKA